MLALSVHPLAVTLDFAAELSLILHHSIVLLNIQLCHSYVFEGHYSYISFPSPSRSSLNYFNATF